MPRLKQMTEREDGWCDWTAPIARGYRMGCCDCGLVHDMEFKIVRVTKTKKGGYFECEDVPTGETKGKHRVLFRARRNNRSTAGCRRKKKS